jgi:hypothetical protein
MYAKKSIKSLAEGLLSHYVFLTKCGVSSSVSEYTFYEPFFRMLNKKKQLIVSCEYIVPLEKSGRGDKPRIDFVIQEICAEEKVSIKNKTQYKEIILLAIEMKFQKKSTKRFGKNAFENDKWKLMKLQEQQERKFGKYIFVMRKTNKSDNGVEGSSQDLNCVIHCVDATYRLDIIEIYK